MRILWLTLGALSVLAGFVGIFLPILPTVPFVLLVAFFFGKSLVTAHNWLLSHKTFGPVIQDWQQSGAISRKFKILSAISMVVIVTMSVFLSLSIFVIIIQLVILLPVSYFIWTRPEC